MLNAHCHLELSHLGGRIPPGLKFVQWLEQIVYLKRTCPLSESRHGAARGLERLRETGTTAVFDILSLETSENILRITAQVEEEFKALLFWEMINFVPGSACWAIDKVLARQFFEGALPPGAAHGLSPHSPYTTTPDLLSASGESARENGMWLCIHAAETREETEMMTSGSGELFEFLKRVLPPDWKAPGQRPIEYLSHCGCLGERTLLAHCNDINDDDIELIVGSGASVVLCPGTHSYFGREDFPLERLWKAGVPLYLGTDSLASNLDLDMSREVEIAKELAPNVPADFIDGLVEPSRADRFFHA